MRAVALVNCLSAALGEGQRRRRWGCRAVVLLATGVTAGSACAPAGAAGASLNWPLRLRIDSQPPFARPTALTGLACPSSGFCIAVDRSGDVLSSTEPLGGDGAWESRSVDAEGGFADLSCPSQSLCFAVDDAGEVLSSSEPQQGNPAWTATRVDGWTPLASISCPSAQLCVAGSAKGELAVSTDPASYPSEWQVVDPDPGHSSRIGGISCPSPSLCVAVSEEGRILTSTDPAQGAGAWSQAATAHNLFDVSCASQSMCVAGGDAGDVLTATAPTGGAGAWSAAHVGEGSLKRVECPATGLCIASDDAGAAITSGDPTGGAPAWSSTLLELTDSYGGQAEVESVACAGDALCALGDSGSGIVVSGEPQGGEGAWTRSELPVGASSLRGVACPSPNLCVAVDDAGNVLAAPNASHLPGLWRQDHVDAHELTDVACHAGCVAVDDAGGVVASGNPWVENPVWTRSDIDGEIPLEDISCAQNTPLCVAIDREGNVLSSPDPRLGGASWSLAHLAAPESLADISCPLEELCVASGDGAALLSSEPAGGAGAWAPGDFDAGRGISCTDEELCATVRADDGILVSTDPLGGASAWSESQASGINGLSGVACSSEFWGGDFCLATGYGGNGSSGNVLEMFSPAGGSGAWRQSNVYGAPIVPPDPSVDNQVEDLSGAACEDLMCVVVDTQGRASFGFVQIGEPPPFPPEPPSGESGGSQTRHDPPVESEPPAPAASFLIRQARVDQRGEVVLSLHALAPGSFRARARLTPLMRSGVRYRDATAAADSPGNVTLALKLRSPARGFRHLRSSKVRVIVTYLPRDGGRLTKHKILPIG